MGEIANKKAIELIIRAKEKYKQRKLGKSIEAMELVQAKPEDFHKLREAYKDVINRTEGVKETTRWVYGKHPTDEMIQGYIDSGYMYIYTDGDRIAGMMAVTPSNDEVYHQIEWKQKVSDEEVSVVHILAVTPDYQGYGLGDVMVSLAVALALRNHCKSIRLDSLASNTPAHHLYKKHGFEFRGKLNLMAQNTGWTDFYFYEKDL